MSERVGDVTGEPWTPEVRWGRATKCVGGTLRNPCTGAAFEFVNANGVTYTGNCNLCGETWTCGLEGGARDRIAIATATMLRTPTDSTLLNTAPEPEEAM